MANYYAYTKTSKFRVTDEAKYQELYSGLCSFESELYDFSYTDESGTLIHGFGAYDCIDWVDPNDKSDTPEYSIDKFFDELQKILPEDEAFILQEVGYEKLRYLVGYATIVTANQTKTIDIGDAEHAAKEMLAAKPHWEWFEEWSESNSDHPAECEDAGWRCSSCKMPLADIVGGYWDDIDEVPKLSYCPNCGKKMEK